MKYYLAMPEFNKFCLILILLAGTLSPVQAEPAVTGSPAFEPVSGYYVAAAGPKSISVGPGEIRYKSRQDGAGGFSLRWIGSSLHAKIAGDHPSAGVTNYMAGPDPAKWRLGVPHFSRVKVTGLYPGIDAVYYFRGPQAEFDLHIRPGATPETARFEILGGSIAQDLDGSLTVRHGGEVYQYRLPKAYQMRGEVREAVDCGYQVGADGSVGFQLGPYDPARTLIIDPVLEYLTYWGGDGVDNIQSVTLDASGDPVVAGLTNSSNFPGLADHPAGDLSVFVSKLDPSGTTILYTTVLGSRSGADVRFLLPRSLSLEPDSQGNVYITGYQILSDFPTTAGAWQTMGAGAFAAKLDGSGGLIYSTFLGLSSWGLSPVRMWVRDGVAYIAGNVGHPEFLGTAGAFQRDIAGSTDVFALALMPDGSGPVFVTAFGGSGGEALGDMALDNEGNLVLAGSSSSADLPMTAGVPPAASANEAFLARLDPSGSRVIDSTWLGAGSVSGVERTPDGNLVLAGGGSLSPDLIAGAPQRTVPDPGGKTFESYILKWSTAEHKAQWSTSTPLYPYSSHIYLDAAGNLYWPSVGTWPSGGAFLYYGSYGLLKFSADGANLLYSSGIPNLAVGQYVSFNYPPALAVGQTGEVWLAGSTNSASLPVTSDAFQPKPDPSTVGGYPSQNLYDGYLARVDLSSFSTGNFFASTSALSLTWRIGQPLPAAVTVPDKRNTSCGRRS